MEFNIALDGTLYVTKSLADFWNEHSEWSQKTFGLDSERGPNGPLNHLKKEVDELLEKPNDLEEYADGVFLLFDAARRAGFTYHQLTNKCFEKLEKNKKRVWGKPDENGVVEHVRGIHD